MCICTRLELDWTGRSLFSPSSSQHVRSFYPLLRCFALDHVLLDLLLLLCCDLLVRISTVRCWSRLGFVREERRWGKAETTRRNDVNKRSAWNRLGLLGEGKSNIYLIEDKLENYLNQLGLAVFNILINHRRWSAMLCVRAIDLSSLIIFSNDSFKFKSELLWSFPRRDIFPFPRSFSRDLKITLALTCNIWITLARLAEQTQCE